MNQITYIKKLKEIRNSMPDEIKMLFDSNFLRNEKNKSKTFLYSFFLGFLGIDRFYLGENFMGLFKLFTFGGFGILGILDWFRSASLTRRANLRIARYYAELIK